MNQLLRDITFKQLRKNTKQVNPEFPKIEIALLGDSSTQFLKTAINGYAVEFDLNANIYEADYDQIDQEVFNPSSDLYENSPEFVILYFSVEKLLHKFYKTDLSERKNFAKNQIEYYKNICFNINDKLSTKVIFFNFPFINDGIFGNYGAKNGDSFNFQLSKLNYELMEWASFEGNLFLFDLNGLQNQVGTANRVNPKFYYSSQLTLSIEVLPQVAKEIWDIIFSIKGTKLNKCLILDLDNTTWGGVIGDDGMEGIQIGDLGIGRIFTDLQLWAKELKRRGIILCVCSKNTDHIAKEPFEKHPDMVLKLDDISVFVANWENKADNIRHIKEVLNIGFDSMVFIDDNPFERNLVRTEIPEVTVPELPKDSAEYLSFLRTLNLFETASVSKEDSSRTQKYQEEAKRLNNKKSYKSIDDYLGSLDMVGEIAAFQEFSIPRIAQLTQRSNQFNLRTIRYTEEDIKKITSNQEDFMTFQIKLEDKYGEYGLISLVIGEKKGTQLFLDTWIMSCRVLKRGVEKFVLNQIVEECKLQGIQEITGEWLETKKNIIVKDHYKDLGFTFKGDFWRLNVSTFTPNKNYIALKS